MVKQVNNKWTKNSNGHFLKENINSPNLDGKVIFSKRQTLTSSGKDMEKGNTHTLLMRN